MNRVYRSVLFLSAAFLSASASADAPKKVLVVLSSASEMELQGGARHEIGFFLNELMVPLQRLRDEGYQPVFATPDGSSPHLDPASDDPKFFGGVPQTHEKYKALYIGLRLGGKGRVSSLKNIAEGDLSDYIALFVPGGHPPMVDLIRNPSLGKILEYFHAHQKPTGMICHGPVALISTLAYPDSGLVDHYLEAVQKGDWAEARTLAKGWAYAGYPATVYSTAEEKGAEAKKFGGHRTKFYPEDALSIAGARMSEGESGKPHTAQYRELITGQNPYSDVEFAQKFVELIKSSNRRHP
jgi:putative intracellular protease/amidase